LQIADLQAVLGATTDAWDLLVAVDTFPYLGDLEPVFDAAWTALRPDGWFAFTTEMTDRDAYWLRGNGRYAHGPSYLRRLAQGRFEVASQVSAPLRREAGGVVEGDTWLLRRIG
jgi:predicted TPR repeat methyltransferase